MKLTLRILFFLHLSFLIFGVLLVLLQMDYISAVKFIFVGFVGSTLFWGARIIYRKNGRMPNVAFFGSGAVYLLCIISLLFPFILENYWPLLAAGGIFNMLYYSYEILYLDKNLIPQEKWFYILFSFFIVMPFILGLEQPIFYNASAVMLTALSIYLLLKLAIKSPNQ
ncbi:MAG: hypothetical protein ACI9XP_001736 [Lentimonas sp.]|jgi:hypothetical protein